MKKSQVYFIMYIVLITELLIVILERDELMEKEEQIKNKMIASIASQYERDVELNAPIPISQWQVGKDSVSIPINAIGLISDEEKAGAVYTIKSEGNRGPGGEAFPASLTSNDKDGTYLLIKDESGNARLFIPKASAVGDYEFTVTLTVKRQLPDYLPDFLKEELKTKSNFKDGEEVTTKPVKFKIQVKAEPVQQQQAPTKKGDVINVGPSID
ncbi:MAG: Ig domain-containing protein [Ignavibacteriales bacterium]|nr:MAG: hypothetical protein F9K26_03635 [Ignavibacteriaceae bacterium]MBW7872526.1 hypothetical protein [Ignavibacteria bacterium]MCZ2141921.1 Ig domain-containing protein [Ignavibacteriales bacterium]OQY79539.1 MAG: hypothetical protein B6D45_00685 [Ignavibacteriales bacterium UTCHB3]MBV6445087.1 hypothetical protein [Ignavibacteriaceae bacterium]